MKKSILSILFILLLSCAVSSQTHSFDGSIISTDQEDRYTNIGEDIGLNLYKNIDEGFETLERKNYQYELIGEQESISVMVNEYIKNQTRLVEEGIGWDCIDKDMSTIEFNSIAAGNIALLTSKISDSCKTEDKAITIQKIQGIQSYINDIQSIAVEASTKKAKEIHQISRIGLYSDGIDENSSFDLISDLEDIDKIIFSQDIPYEGEEYEDLNDYFESHFTALQSSGDNESSPTTNLSQIIIHEKSQSGSEAEEQKVEGNPFVGLGDSQYVCSVEQNNSETLLLSEITQTIESLKDSADNLVSNNNISKNISEIKNTFLNNVSKPEVPKYQAINDNGVWPCNNFFCITIEFITYNHKLLGGGQDTSIEYLVNRSNTHLKKFTNTSLIQADMTNNNFELGLKNLNLPDIFNMSVQIQSKPVPLLDVVSDSNEEKNDKLTATNMLEEYYKSLDLEYQRRNDLSIYNHNDQEKKSIIDSANLTNADAVKSVAEYVSRLEKNSAQLEFNPQFTNKYISYDEIDRFSQHFLELERFADSIFEYTVSINSIIRKMNEIPLDPS